MQSRINHQLLKRLPFLSVLPWLLAALAGLPQANAANIEILPPTRILICLGDTLHLQALVSPNSLPITWTPNDGSITPLSDSSVIVMPQQATWYYAQVNDASGPAIDSVFIDVQEVFVDIAPVEEQGRCADEPFLLTATSNVEGTFTWTPPNLLTESLVGDTVLANVRDTTLYTASILAECGIAKDTIRIFAQESPEINIFCFNLNTENPLLVEGQESDIFVLPNNFPGAEFVWEDGETDPNRTVLPTSPASTYSVTVTYPNGCIRMASKTFSFALLPNAFVPDGPVPNNFFTPLIFAEIDIQEFKIYNRWGQLVYDNETPDLGWDGTHNGQPATSDVYLYQLILVQASGKETIFRGNVTLIR